MFRDPISRPRNIHRRADPSLVQPTYMLNSGSSNIAMSLARPSQNPPNRLYQPTSSDIRDAKDKNFRISVRKDNKEDEMSYSRNTQATPLMSYSNSMSNNQTSTLQSPPILSYARNSDYKGTSSSTSTDVSMSGKQSLYPSTLNPVDSSITQLMARSNHQSSSLSYGSNNLSRGMIQSTAPSDSIKKQTNLRSDSAPSNLGLVGLDNIGNTCYMNSALQCILNLPNFNEAIVNQSGSGRVYNSYSKLVRLIRSTSRISEAPYDVKSAVANSKSRFLGSAQQDAQQFLTAILQLLSNEMNRSKNPRYRQMDADVTKESIDQIAQKWWNYSKERQDSVIVDYFAGQILSRVRCRTCQLESLAFDTIWDIALDFGYSTQPNLMGMIKGFLKEETLADDYYCKKCKGLKQCTRKFQLYRMPRILVIQLKRFTYGRFSKSKLTNIVRIPSQLDFQQLGIVSSSAHYQLRSVINHSGTIDFGHYTAECRNPFNNRWYQFNDSSVSESRDRNQFESSNAYVLFYAQTKK